MKKTKSQKNSNLIQSMKNLARRKVFYLVLLFAIGVGVTTAFVQKGFSSNDIIGWGWFGASTTSDGIASPGWLSLHCKNSDSCLNPSTGNGVDFGLILNDSSPAAPTRSNLTGYGWFGVYDGNATSADNVTPADPAPLGWVSFDQSGPYPSEAGDGTADDRPYVDKSTDQVWGWARSLTLKDYGISQGYSNWGWISLRGGTVDPASFTSGFGSCYDCNGTDKTCGICETDVNYYSTSGINPSIYACNLCTNCGPNQKCRLTGDDCTTAADCNGGSDDDCQPICQDCATCNQWGVSMEILPGNKGRFHGYAWSAGGDAKLGSSSTPTYTNDVGLGWVDFNDISMITPWTQTQYGDIYSRGNIGATGGAAPAGRYNATFIMETGPGSQIIAWSTQQVSPSYLRAGEGASIFLPRPSSGYTSFLGRIDYAGLTEGGGTALLPGQNNFSNRVVDQFTGDDCDDNTMLWSKIKDQVLMAGALNGGIYHIGTSSAYCQLVIDEPITFSNGGIVDPKLGRGLFIIEGDLEVNADIGYDSSNVTATEQLASVGWFVKGNVVVNPTVGNMVGAYVVLGCEVGGNCTGVSADNHSGTFSTGVSTSQILYVYGLAMAKKFNFERRHATADTGSEVFISNGRERANTPPGMASISQALPRDITSVPPE